MPYSNKTIRKAYQKKYDSVLPKSARGTCRQFCKSLRGLTKTELMVLFGKRKKDAKYIINPNELNHLKAEMTVINDVYETTRY